MKKLISVLLALCMALTMCAGAIAETSVFAGGSGTDDDPYQIATLEQFFAFAASVNDGSAQGYPGQTIALTADIDAAGANWQPAGHMDLEDMSNYSCMFMGTLDGQGHTISNITFHSDYPVCGVGVVGMNLGEVKNLIVENVDIRCEDTYSMAVGGVVGYNMGYVHDVTLTGENDIAGVNAIGGLCGFSGTHSNGNIVADTEGIATTEYPSVIDNCVVTVKMNVPGATHVGGLVGTGLYYYGEETAFKISNCSVNGEIIGAVTPARWPVARRTP